MKIFVCSSTGAVLFLTVMMKLEVLTNFFSLERWMTLKLVDCSSSPVTLTCAVLLPEQVTAVPPEGVTFMLTDASELVKSNE